MELPENSISTLEKYLRNQKITALIVEDNHEHFDFLHELLKDLPFLGQIIRASSGFECLKIIEDQPQIGLILLDFRLPDIGGLEVLEKIDTQKTVVIMITSQGDIPSAIAAMKGGAVDFIIKDRDIFQTLPILIEKNLTQFFKEKYYRNIEKILQEKEKLSAIGTLAASIAHEIGSPLNVVSGRAEMLLGTMGQDQKKRKNLEIIIEQIQRISTILTRFLSFSKRSRGEKGMQKISTILSDVLEFLAPVLDKNEIKTDLIFDKETPLLLEKTLIQQIFINLIMNSIDALQGEKEATIFIRGKPVIERGIPYFEIIFGDDGCGAPPALIDHLFEPFFTTKNFEKGTGLGLTITKSLVEEHDGFIHVLNESPFKGLTFQLLFPLKREKSL